MLKCGGVWVSPVEIESVLLEHPMVQEAAAIGCQDGNQLTQSAAYVVLKKGLNGTPETIEGIKKHMLSRLAAYKCPRTVELVAELPKTATGKIQRYKLREMASGK